MNLAQDVLENLPQGSLLKGKKGLIMGLANDKSIAWGIAAACALQGADLAITYQGDIMKKRAEPLAESLGSSLLISCDVLDDASLEALFKEIEQKWGKLDFLVHAIAFSDKNELKGRYSDTSMDNFLNTMNVSCYSFTKIAKMAAPLMKDAGSMVTLSYYGAEKYVPHYNVMGVAKAALEASVKYLANDMGKDNIRVNAISAGPIKTLAASGIGDFRYILKWNEYNSPLKRNTTIWDVGKASLALLSDLGSGITGELVHVDSGYHTVGMKQVDAPDIETS
ncbi:MAG: enoyl-ACP reductase FabI [Rickettsiales bacterium]|jgi:enoyl-[acyl-carrier protein] reductase I|nr:enoyl-ACP reductase FabI [Rickettsiales bacterium]